MIWARLFWAAFLAGMLGFCFHRAWRWEHGEGPELVSKKRGKETVVWLPPTVLFWILLVLLIAFVLRFGASEGIARSAALTGDVMLILSVYFALLLAVMPLLRRRFSARACAVLWLVPAFLSWQANALLSVTPLPRRTIYVPRSALPVIGGVWLAGFLAVGGYYLISHLRFRAWVKNHSSIDFRAEDREIWKREREALEYRRDVTLRRGAVAAPFSMGRTNRSRCLVLPERDYTAAELTMIFRHELHHLQRCDVDTKVFLCLCRAFCWFNPLVWIAARRAAEDLERSCDEIVTEGMDAGERRAYAGLLLDAAGPERGCTTCLSAAAGTLRYRLKSVVEQPRRLLGTALLMAALFGCVMSFGLVSFSDARGSFPALLLADGEIEYVYDPGHPEAEINGQTAAALRKALERVELEHVAGLRDPVQEGERVTLLLRGGAFVTLSEDAAVVLRFRRFPQKDCFLVRGGVDFGAIRAAAHTEESS